MKRLLGLLVMATLFSCSSSDDSNFKITGKIDGIKKGKLVLRKEVEGTIQKVDSAIFNGNTDFEFKGFAASPEMYFLSLERRENDRLPLFVEEGEISVEGHVDSLYTAKVTGSATQEDYEEFSDFVRSFRIRKLELEAEAFNALKEEDIEKAQKLNEQAERMDTRYVQYIANYALVNREKAISPYVTLTYLDRADITLLDTLNKALTPEVAATYYGRELDYMVGQIKNTEVGKPLPEFTVSSEEKELSQDQYDGKYLYIMVWSGQAGESEALINNLKEVYTEYHDKGLEVLTTSIDTDKEAYAYDTYRFNMPWPEINEGKASHNELVRKFAFRGVPATVLVGPNGKIIERNINPNQLRNLLQNEL